MDYHDISDRMFQHSIKLDKCIHEHDMVRHMSLWIYVRARPQLTMSNPISATRRDISMDQGNSFQKTQASRELETSYVLELSENLNLLVLMNLGTLASRQLRLPENLNLLWTWASRKLENCFDGPREPMKLYFQDNSGFQRTWSFVWTWGSRKLQRT